MPPNQTALITGASSGIGYALAKLFARDGYHLVLVARDRVALQRVAEELTRAHGVPAMVLAEDLSDPSAPDRIVAHLRRLGVPISVLVNNAGFGMRGFFAEIPWESHAQMMQVNMMALVHFTRLVLPEMRRRGNGRILNVSSTAAFQPGPLMAVYYATKAFVLFFSQAVGYELRHSGVTVTTLCPSLTNTQFPRRAGVEHTLLMRAGLLNVEDVAIAAYRALHRGQALVVPGLRNRFLAGLVRILPRRLVLWSVFRIQESQ